MTRIQSEIFTRKDIEDRLLAAAQATIEALQASGESDAFIQGYAAGYRAALRTMALTFGLYQLFKETA